MNDIAITSVIAIWAIFSPILTAIINNKYLLKMKRLEADISIKKEASFYNRDIYENYLKSAFKYLKKHDIETKHEYSECYALALIYFPDSLLTQLIDINAILRSSNLSGVNEKLESLSKEIRIVLKS